MHSNPFRSQWRLGAMLLSISCLMTSRTLADEDDSKAGDERRRSRGSQITSSELTSAPTRSDRRSSGSSGTTASPTGRYTLIGWNDLGMHCTDGSDFSVFSILPHYNVIHAHLIKDGRRVTSEAGVRVTYQAVADPEGSVNRTSVGKGNFYQHVAALYGADLAPDEGLAGFSMPGPANQPQAMRFDPPLAQFSAEGIPITPYDDGGDKNYYPLMRLVARDSRNQVLAQTDIVLPVSDEMDCRVCHGSQAARDDARPMAGWVAHPDPDKDYKLNILRLHDERHASDAGYFQSLRDAGYNVNGLYATVTVNEQPVLCARCHASNALPGTGLDGIPPLTESIHAYHAHVIDPITNLALDDSLSRASCYRCHPGSETRCLRGAMGSAVAADGSMAMQCQSCHGGMSAVGAPDRVGWLDQPNCSGCHTGTATRNNGAIRYTSVFEADGSVRRAVNNTFGATPDTPAPGFALYRFSAGHGGLQCEACHGPTHAENPSAHLNDNLQSLQLQGHVGTVADCSVCHASLPEKAYTGGPHGMHPIGQTWVEKHHDAASDGRASACRDCHGLDYRGTVLSRAQGDRTFRAFDRTFTFWRGSQIGCYNCHQGPREDDRTRNRAPVVNHLALTTPRDSSLSVVLTASDADRNSLTLRIVSQTTHGTVAFDGSGATYYPDPGFSGQDRFTYAAWDGSTDSNLGEVTILVGP